MGWLFTQDRTKAELIAHLTGGDSNLRTHRKCVRGSTLWTIQENLEYPGFGRFIVAYLMQRDPAGFGWGYKAVDEEMGPAQLSCPLSYLDETPLPDSEFAGPWRDRVRQRHAAKRKTRRTVSSASIGDRIMLREGVRPRTLVLISKSPLIGKAADGTHWRVARRLIDSIGPN